MALYQALYDFDGSPGANQLSFKAGDVFTILEQHEGGWLTAQCNNQIGYVPSNYLTVAETSPPPQAQQPKKVAVATKKTGPSTAEMLNPQKVSVMFQPEAVGPQLPDMDLFEIRRNLRQKRSSENDREPSLEDIRRIRSGDFGRGAGSRTGGRPGITTGVTPSATPEISKRSSDAERVEKAPFFVKDASGPEKSEDTTTAPHSETDTVSEFEDLPESLPPPADNRMHPPYAADAPPIPPRTDKGEEGFNLFKKPSTVPTTSSTPHASFRLSASADPSQALRSGSPGAQSPAVPSRHRPLQQGTSTPAMNREVTNATKPKSLASTQPISHSSRPQEQPDRTGASALSAPSSSSGSDDSQGEGLDSSKSFEDDVAGRGKLRRPPPRRGGSSGEEGSRSPAASGSPIPRGRGRGRGRGMRPPPRRSLEGLPSAENDTNSANRRRPPPRISPGDAASAEHGGRDTSVDCAESDPAPLEAAVETQTHVAESTATAAGSSEWKIVKGRMAKDDAIKLLRRGEILMKQQKKGKPHQRFVCLSEDLERIQWRDVQKSKWDGFIPLSDVIEVRKGHTTPTFLKNVKMGGDVACAFSVICDPKRRGDEKTLDLIAPSKEVRNVWAVAVEAVLSKDEPTDRAIYV